FTWWVNQKDSNGTDIFEGGFLGLDNIGVFDRNHMPPGIKKLQQADATSWMAMYALNMLRMSLELAQHNKAYEESAAKFFRHFLNIGWAMHHIGKKDISLWDEQDAFYYDAIQFENGTSQRLRIRSLVGIIPLFAAEIMHSSIFEDLRQFNTRLEVIRLTRPDLTRIISDIDKKNDNGNYLFAIMIGERMEHLLKRLLDEAEFLSDYGIRSLSKIHQDNPYSFAYKESNYSIQYEPGESSSSMFGGNSNWRGPIWLPLNYLIINSLRKYYEFYGDTYTYEFPAGSGKKMNLKQIANQLTKRILNIFKRNEKGNFQYHGDDQSCWKEEHFKEHHLFYEFFHGDTGQGLGASHQTGWTALIINLLLEMDED
ncbi:MAG TPA: glucosidase, partial [Chitinophagaceae bacterium]|nr:glucosidase [Chitinophagaceae bacterium]